MLQVAKIAVVMSVLNGAETLSATMSSILEQTETDLEVIVVDDGSTDDTPGLLAEIARRDDRVRVLTQPNAGLTRALIRGCAEAGSPFIARHDCGDRSHPERFRRQLEVLDREGDVVLVSCFTSFHAPCGERLYIVRSEGDAVRESLLHGDVSKVRGPSHHGSAMFRRDAYLAAGGYRSQFRFAQDLDLWVRMAPLGRVVFVPEVLYEAQVDPGAISANNRTDQLALARIILRLRDDQSEERHRQLLAQAESTGSTGRRSTRRSDARALYFIASCLLRDRNPGWRSYARRALRRNPLLLRAWLLFVRAER